MSGQQWVGEPNATFRFWMCGRFCLETPADQLSSRLKPWLDQDDVGWLSHYAPRSLIRPQEPVLVLRQEHGRPRLAHVLWGLLPGWVKDPSQGPRPFNARAETLADKASFRGPWRHHRCLLPCSGYLEKGHKIQRQDGQLFWLGGIWDRWIGSDGSEVESCCVITTEPNDLVQPLHNRMPVIIPDGLEEAWLEPGDARHRQALEPLLAPGPSEGWTSASILRPTQGPASEQLCLEGLEANGA